MCDSKWPTWQVLEIEKDDGKRETRRERPKSAPYLRLKNIQGTTIGNIWKKNFFKKNFFSIFFRKKYFLSRTMPKNSKKAIQAHSTFSTNRKLQKNARGYPLIKFENFRKKSHSAEKNPKRDPLVSPVLLEALKNFWFSARIEPTIYCFSEN